MPVLELQMSLPIRPVPIDDAPPDRLDAPSVGHAQPRPHLASEDETPWPWYRSEPWLAVELSGLLPIVVAFVVPLRFRVPLIAIAMVLVVTGLSMLFRQGSFHGHPRPRSPGSTTRRAGG